MARHLNHDSHNRPERHGLNDDNSRSEPATSSPETDPAAAGGAAQPRLLDTAFSGGDNIEKIREILFGHQMRRYEEMFTGLKDRLTGEAAELRRDMDRRLSAIEDQVHDEMAALARRMEAEQEEQSETLRRISRDVQDKDGLYRKKLKQLADEMTKGHRDVRRQLTEETERIADEARRKHEETLSVLDDAIRKLNAEAIDRPTLSRLFQEMALRLDPDLADRLNAQITDGADG
jgi:vacuolar-type H+-ATPase subunit I/STV1